MNPKLKVSIPPLLNAEDRKRKRKEQAQKKKEEDFETAQSKSAAKFLERTMEKK